ncbi:MFS general substrate transporter [Trichoderma citrinoviride]|uniref:MFS general substrate transporter n=1 Tax=Trichoderma citrinoviride TaxID=58853 RepID=A0A2T4BGM1_9HYPO|nr:MFS general substrate transporter [Trichoderma citrinoviride]PTB68476.1 MFS general substrate transporter [Trichoderma citrinoviride]
MKTSRYAISRQKACQQCSIAKARCDRKERCCSRCALRHLPCLYPHSNPTTTAASKLFGDSRDAEFLDFSTPDLICPINAEEISNRWLNAYIPLPGQSVKNYPATVSAFIYRLLKSYTGMAVHGRGFPPFVHVTQLMGPHPSPLLSTCLSIIRICDKPLPGSENVTAEILQREMSNIYERRDTYDHLSMLSAFQAFLMYTMVLFFRLSQGNNPVLRQAMMNLQELACVAARQGLMSLAEQRRTRPKWESWVIAEAKRRTIFTMYLFDSVLSSEDGLTTFLGTELEGLPAVSSKTLWLAQTRRDWEAAYNVHLAEWDEGSLRINELWPIPQGLDEPQVAKRRHRVDSWLEDLDEFGTMLYAITSCTHGGIYPAEPYSIFDSRQRAFIVIIVSTAATFSGFASNIYFPALPTIASDLHVSIELVNLTVTSYLIFQGIAPSLWGPVSDVKGRRVAYCCTFLVFVGACVGLAETNNYATLVVLRCLQSTGSASTIAIGSGVIGDITTRANRGGLMGIFQAGLLVPVAIGPVIGGAIAGSLGWRAIFWFLTGYGGGFLVFLVVFLPETLRSVVANGSRTPSSPMARYPLVVYQKLTKIEWNGENSAAAPDAKKRIDVLGPFRILFSKHATPIIVFLSIYYAVWQMSITAMSTLFEQKYHLKETQIGLTFIANGVGSMVGTLITGKILDKDYKKVKAAHDAAQQSQMATDGNNGVGVEEAAEDSFPLEKARLRLVPLFSIIQCLSILLFGWTINYPDKVPIAIPIISTFITGWTAVSTQSIIMTYLVDVFSDRSAAASASLNLARCLFAAGGTSIVMPMVNGIGVGWAFTICAVVQLVALLGPAVQWRFAAGWRRQARMRNGK